jgi:L-threonylcarbamoyladenylate synthase
MQTKVLSIDDVEARGRAALLLQNDQVIAAPTDTVYGVMCRFDSAAAIGGLYLAKQRPPQKPIPVLIGDREQLDLVVAGPLPPPAERLMEHFWPGPLTLVLPARESLPAILTAGQPTVGVRMPDHAALRELIRHAGPLAATSANLSGAPEARTAAEVLAQLEGRIPLVLEDTSHPAPRALLPSTLVDLAAPLGPEPRILREGPIGDDVRRVWAQSLGYGAP